MCKYLYHTPQKETGFHVYRIRSRIILFIFKQENAGFKPKSFSREYTLLNLFQQINHLDSRGYSLETFVSGFCSGSFNSLLDRVGRQNTENNRYSGL